MLVVLGQRHNEAFGGDAQATASAHLHVRAFQLGRHRSVAVQHHDVEAVAVAVADQNVTRVARVDAAWVRRQRFVAEPTNKLAVLGEHTDTVALKITQTLRANTAHSMEEIPMEEQIRVSKT